MQITKGIANFAFDHIIFRDKLKEWGVFFTPCPLCILEKSSLDPRYPARSVREKLSEQQVYNTSDKVLLLCAYNSR